MKRSFLFRFLIILLVLVLIVIGGALALFPTLISTEKGKTQFVTYLNERISGHLEIQKLKLSWFGEQQIEGFSLLDENKNEILTFTCFSTKTSLFSLLLDHYRFKQTQLIAPSLFLQEESDGQLNLERALSSKTSAPKIKKGKGKTHIPRFKGNLCVESGLITIKTPKIEAITLSNVEMEINEKIGRLQLTANTRQGIIEGSLDISSKRENQKISLSADINRIPTALFDQLFESPLFSAAIGPTLDCKLSIEEKADRFFLIANIKAANLQGELVGVASSSTFTFDPKSKLYFTLTPAFFSSAFESKQWKLANKTDVTLAIKELKLPLNLFTKLPSIGVETLCFPFSAELLLPRAELVHESFGNLSLIDAKVNFFGIHALEIAYSGEMQSKEGRATMAGSMKCERNGKFSFYGNYKEIPTPLLELLFAEGSTVSQLIGSRFDLVTSGAYDRGRTTTTFAITTQNLLFDGTAQGESTDSINLQGKGKFFLPQNLALMLGASADFILDSELSFSNHHLSIPLFCLNVKNPALAVETKGILGKKGKPFSYKDVDLVVKGNFPRQEKVKIFDRGTLFAHINGAKNEIVSDLDLSSSSDTARTATAHAKITNFVSEDQLDLAHSQMTFEGEGKELPVALLQELIGMQKFPLPMLIGEKIDLDLSGNYFPNEKASLTFNTCGNGFNVKLALCIDPQLARIETKPFEVSWEINDDRYQALYQYLSKGQPSRYRLTDCANATFSIDKLSCPSMPITTPLHFLAQTALLGEFAITPLSFEEKASHKKLTIEKSIGKIESENFQKAVQLAFDSTLRSDELSEVSESPSQIFFQGTLVDLLTPEGRMNLTEMKAVVDLKVDLLPVRSATALFPIPEAIKRPTDALLGNIVNAHLQGEFLQEKGPITIDVKSTNLKALLPLHYDHGLITLTRNVEAELTLTPEINELFLKDLNPLFITGAFSSHPIRFYIESQGFSLPLTPFQLTTVQIDKAVLDLGQIEVKNGGQIEALMEFLKATEVTPEGLMKAWFTPIFFSLKGGILSYQRFDMLLAEKVHIALWGAIDLQNDKVKMTLGINPKNLRARFNLIGLSKKDMFQVKMRGSTSELELDWSSAYTRIGILLTRTAGGHIGYLVGGILEQIVEALGEEPTPPPSTSPLPWEESTTNQNTDQVGMPQITPPPPESKNDGLKKIWKFLVP